MKTGALSFKGEKILISDTVGFIKNLPHELVASFRATLSEVKEADLLLIVFDVSSENLEAELESVKAVLKRLNSWNKEKIYVGNKVDRLVEGEDERRELYQVVAGKIPDEKPEVVFVSAKEGWGIDELKSLIYERLNR
ncbi:MAG: hypothetical protein DSZ25_01930 [Thermovibrio sp.]|nr:MAG: hypothetical protein DSZ25_01930 [Thermovibrio sp.]